MDLYSGSVDFIQKQTSYQDIENANTTTVLVRVGHHSYTLVDKSMTVLRKYAANGRILTIQRVP